MDLAKDKLDKANEQLAAAQDVLDAAKTHRLMPKPHMTRRSPTLRPPRRTFRQQLTPRTRLTRSSPSAGGI